MSKRKTSQQTPAHMPQQVALPNASAMPAARPSSGKIQDPHRQRLAIVYVRQSTPQQVMEHRESKDRQYALADHAQALGWSAERILVIDEDQGQSGKSAQDRAGFQRLLAEVTMEHVGLVLGLEMSWLARSSQDWHHLFELCGPFGSLLADEDGVYDPNDRLLLGLTRILSELELHTMSARLNRGSLNKAQRGELFLHTAIGYVRLPSGGVDFDPDEQVRAVVQLIFDKFEEFGTATAVLRYLARHGIRIGVRPSWGPNRGQVEWRRPCRTTILNLLRTPIYAGAYAFGRRRANPQKYSYRRHRTTRPSLKMEDWKVLLQDRVPAYITWERHLAIVQRIGQNRAGWETLGAPRKGPALLVGLIHCGQCGGRLTIHYGTQIGRGWYDCHRRAYDPDAPPCPHVPADLVDGLVCEQVLLALEPAAQELSIQASQDIQHERERMSRLWEQRPERARYEAERAERQYNTVEP